MFRVNLDTVDPDDAEFVAYLKAHNIEAEKVSRIYDCIEVNYTGSLEDLQAMIVDFWHDDYLFCLIEEI